MANLLDDATLSDGRYSYRADGYVAAPLPRRAVPRAVTEDFSETVEQFGVDYLQLPAGSRLEFNGTPTINLTALTPSDGAAWFARRGDERSATLTRRIDLRGDLRRDVAHLAGLFAGLICGYVRGWVRKSGTGDRCFMP